MSPTTLTMWVLSLIHEMNRIAIQGHKLSLKMVTWYASSGSNNQLRGSSLPNATHKAMYYRLSK